MNRFSAAPFGIQPFHRHRRAAHVAREPLQLRSLLGFYTDPSVQRKPRVLRHAFARARLVLSHRHGL
jgi:hypothetical protein